MDQCYWGDIPCSKKHDKQVVRCDHHLIVASRDFYLNVLQFSLRMPFDPM